MTDKKYRLPTEAEWEYAAGGGASNRTKWAGTDSEIALDDYAWYNNNSDIETHPVKEKLPNALGLYDMSGNVWEWCEDDSHDNYEGVPTDGSAWVDSQRSSERVVRGGSWGSFASYTRAACRGSYSPDSRLINIGFRLALSL
jgi:formylglycine-generating enzyme required for sulfatase activity